MPPAAGTTGTKGFGHGTAEAAAWALIALAAGRLISLAALVCLARLLAPADFGLLAFALAFITYAETISDLGTSAALIYWPGRGDARDGVAQVTFVISVAAGFLLLALAIACAPAVAAFFREADTAAVLRALAWTFPLKALGATHDALAQKDLRFRARVVPEIALAAFKAATSIVLAVLGFGVWSLVAGHLAGVLAWTVLLWIVVPWRPRLSLPLDLLRPVLAYGRSIVAVNVLAAVVHHADLLIVGRMLGAPALGFYQVAGRVPDVTLMMVVRAAGKVLFPAFARAGSDTAALRAAYLSALKYVTLLVAPAAVAMMLLAEPIVIVLFGPTWLPSAPILRALAAYAGLRAIGTHAGDALKAAGRPGLLAAAGLLKAAMIVPALVAAARVDAAAVASALAAVTLISVVMNLAIVTRVLGIPARGVLAALRPAVVSAAAVALALALWTTAAAMSAAVALAGGAALALLAAGAAAQRVTPEVPAAIRRSLAPWVFPRRAPEAAITGGRR